MLELRAVAEPEPKGEKEFKAKHKVKKSGDKEDGTNMKEEITISIDYMHKIDEKLKPGKGKETIDVDYIGDKGLTKKLESKFKVKIKQTGSTTADITGEKKNILSFMKSDAYMMDDGDIEELFPELLESVSPEMADELPAAGKETGYMDEEEKDLSPAQKKYQAFFKKALKKFGAESPADLDDEKKKEFFNYIDKNYKSVDESITERFKAKPPMAGMHLTGFEGKLKLNQQSGHEDNHSDAVIKDFKAAVKIVDKHLKKLGMKSVPEVFVGPKDVAKEKGVKVGAFASDFAISVYPGFRDGPKLPSGKKDSEINFYAENQPTKIIIYISDQGVGIKDDEKLKIFDRFYRIEDEDTRSSKGTGLGLFLVNQIVKMHGGKIICKDNIPNGCIFQIQFKK